MKAKFKYLSSSIMFLLLPFFHFGQGEFNNWYFGNSAGITFNYGSPSSLNNCAASFFSVFSTATISDSLGNLLFYADYNKVFSKNHTLMPNGTSLASEMSVEQPLFVIKTLYDDSLYYLFTMDRSYHPPSYNDPKGLCYSIVDLRLNGGLGDIVIGQKNVQIPGAEQTAEVLTATRHRNNRDAWIIVRNYFNSDEYLSYKITQTGINTNQVVSNSLVTLLFQSPTNWVGNIKVSPDGSRLICVYDSVSELCFFDSESGQIIPMFCFIGPPPFTGTPEASGEFSPDSKFLYIQFPNAGHSDIFQYNLLKTDSLEFVQSATYIGQVEYLDAGFQLATDGKIYITSPEYDSISVINNPDVQGSGCGFQKNILGLNGNITYKGFPQFLQSYYVYPHSAGNCQGSPVHFSMTVWPPADSAWWSFGDPGSGAANISNELEPAHVYDTAGSYNVILIVRHNDKRFDTAWMTVEIHETPQPLLGPDQTICQGDSVTLDAGLCSGCTYVWTSIPPGFSSTSQIVTINQSGVYTIAVTTTDGCTGRDTMQLSLTIPPVVTNSPLSSSICSGESISIPLSSTIPGSTFSWTATGSSPHVSGYSAGTGDTIDQALTNTGPVPETVTYTITPAVGDCEGDSGQYVVTVTPGDSVNISISASVDSICDGTPVTFHATTINGGTTPAFQWKVNGINQGISDSIFTYVPDNGDSITCVLTSSNTICTANNPAASNAIRMTLYPNLPVSVSVSTMENPVCEGNEATITATTGNKGALPVFQWFVNGNPVGTNDSIVAYTSANGDQVYCVLTSSEQCTSNNPATSDTITMMVNPLLPVGISISASANPVCEGLPVTLTGAAINGGSTPVYQWQVNGVNAGINNAVFTYTPVNGDSVRCMLTSSESCISNNPASSNRVSMIVVETPEVTFTPCFDTITTTNAKPIRLRGGIPLGGIYCGPGVTGSTGGTGWTFDPALAGAGIHQITYNYINEAGCQDSARLSIVNYQLSIVNCGDSLTDIRDNKKYPTIQIGSQCWMAANLDYGTEIAYTIPQRDNCIPEKYTRPTSYVPRPTFYQWDEVMQYDETPGLQGLCPPGWHIPTEAEWQILFSNWTNSAFAGAPLKYSGYSGFNALLTGAGFFNSNWFFPDFATFFWSSTSHGPRKAWAHGMNETNYSVSYYPSFRSNAFSVRCVRD